MQQMGTGKAGWEQQQQKKKTRQNKHPHQSSSIPCFREDLCYLTISAKSFEQTVSSLRRPQTVCCPLFVRGWHYFLSTAEWQCFLKNDLPEQTAANTCLGTNGFVCLTGKMFI